MYNGVVFVGEVVEVTSGRVTSLCPSSNKISELGGFNESLQRFVSCQARTQESDSHFS